MDLSAIKYILFDFGGCLDSDGIHSRELFYNCFNSVNALQGIGWNEFQEGYSYSDQLVCSQGLIKGAGLSEMNKAMCYYIGEKISISLDLVDAASDLITRSQSVCLTRNSAVLRQLSGAYKLGMISNFSGNLNVILKEFLIDSYFDFVLDSYCVGYKKPTEKIFQIALNKAQCSAGDVLMVGDNVERDILPARNLGMNTVLIRNSNSKYICNKECHVADMILSSILEFPSIIQNK